jgi:type IV pilus assembly protein PilW
MKIKLDQRGFSLIELMVATALGLVVAYAVLQIYLAQTNIYKASNSQDLILNTSNAVTNLVTPTLRSAGFFGCSSISTAITNLNAGGPDPLGSFTLVPSMIAGYSGGASSFTLTQVNPANDTNASHWSPTLPSTLLGQVEQGNDVIVVLGAAPYSRPTPITLIDASSSSFTLQSLNGNSIAAGQYGAVSDCVKSVLFQITSATSTIITHASGAGTLQNASSTFPVNFQVGSQFMPLQQTAFFVGQGHGGQSSLMRGVLNGSTWTIEPIVPGIEVMKIQYGIGANGVVTQYVAASAVTNWAQVYAVRLGFLISGQQGSGVFSTTSYTVLNTPVVVPNDGRLRHVFEITVNFRNALL